MPRYIFVPYPYVGMAEEGEGVPQHLKQGHLLQQALDCQAGHGVDGSGQFSNGIGIFVFKYYT